MADKLYPSVDCKFHEWRDYICFIHHHVSSCCSAWSQIYDKWINFNQKQYITFVMQILESAISKLDIKENCKTERFNPFTFKVIMDP